MQHRLAQDGSIIICQQSSHQMSLLAVPHLLLRLESPAADAKTLEFPALRSAAHHSPGRGVLGELVEGQAPMMEPHDFLSPAKDEEAYVTTDD